MLRPEYAIPPSKRHKTGDGEDASEGWAGSKGSLVSVAVLGDCQLGL